MKDIDDFIEKYLELLPTNGTLSDVEVANRASQFLECCAHLIAYKHKLQEELIEATSKRDSVYAVSLASAEGSSDPKRKANAEANPNYLHSRESMERVEAQVYTIKSYYDIFFNAHVFYRQLGNDFKKSQL